MALMHLEPPFHPPSPSVTQMFANIYGPEPLGYIYPDGTVGYDFEDEATQKDRLALKTLTLPGGLGSTHKVLILAKGVGKPALRCCSLGQRLT